MPARTKPIRRTRASAQQRAFARLVTARLRAAYPDADCALQHANPLQLLIATILSAQCTDKRVNMVTPALFARYPDAEAFARADRAELESLIRSTGFYRNKARNIQHACLQLASEFDGQVPDTMEALVSLPGVARKTANVVLGVAYGKAEGVVVDTHVKRISRLLGLTRQATPEKIELDLIARLPREAWIDYAHMVIGHGRAVCKARRPLCAACNLNDVCPSARPA